MDHFTNFFGNLGLGILFFFAGYEIDFDRIRGRPLELGLLAWALSLVLPLVGMRLRHGRIEEAADEGGLDELALERGGPATAPT